MGTMIRNFEIADYAKIKDPIEGVSVISEDDLAIIERGVSITVEDEKGIVGCGGVILYDSDNGEMWLRLSKRANKLAYIDAILAAIRMLVNAFDGVKLYCRVKQGFKKGERFVRWLGFVLEREQDNYGVYVWLKY